MAAWFIDDLDQTLIRITDGVKVYDIPKFDIDKALLRAVDGDWVNIVWSNLESGTGGGERHLPINYLDVADGYSGYVNNPTSATDLANQLLSMIVSGFSTSGGDILVNKGDLLSHNGVSDEILSIGDNGEVLMANSAEPTGQKWTELIHSITFDSSGIKLVNDSATPGNSKYYGTSSVGTKGFHDVPSSPLSSYVIGTVGTVASTNTAAEEALGNVLIPGGTLAVGDMIEVKTVGRKTSGTGANTFRVRIHSATGTGGTIIADYATTAQQSYVQGPMVQVTGAATQTGWPPFSNATYSVGAAAPSALTLTIANDIWINITNTKVTSGDGFSLFGAEVIIHKKR